MQDPNKLLKQAVADITQNINKNKLSAHDAVVKVAKELDLNVHLIKRASEAINVALTYDHFKKHADARDADFPIVDFDKVASEVFTPTSKTTNEKRSEWFSVVDNDIPDFNKIIANPRIKQAYASLRDESTSEGYDSYGLSQKGICEKSAACFDRMEKEIDDLKTKTAGLKFDVYHSFMKVANEFSKDPAYRKSFSSFEKQAYALYGDRAVPYLDLVHKASGTPDTRGEHDVKYASFEPYDTTKQFGQFLTNITEFNKISSELSETEETFKLANKTITYAYHKYGSVMGSFKEDKEPIKDKVVEKEATIEEVDPVKIAFLKKKEAFNLEQAKHDRTKYAFSLIDTAMDKYKKESTPGLSVPSTSHQDNLDRSLLLRELMVTDPILQASDPKRVVDSYEQFLRLAPELSKEKDVVKGMLRQMVQTQALDPHAAQQLIEANTGFHKQKQNEQGFNPEKR